jgi:hypothetical protein
MASETDIKKPTTNDDPFLLLTDVQWRYVTTMIDNPDFTKKQGAKAVGLRPATIYNWPDHVGAAIEKAREDMHSAALTVRKNALLKAMRVKLALLDNKDARIRDKAATDILEWELGKASQPLTGTGKDGAIAHEVTIDVSKLDIDAIKELAAWDTEDGGAD